jgi:hypothetical protein
MRLKIARGATAPFSCYTRRFISAFLLLAVAPAPAARFDRFTTTCGTVFRNGAPYRAIGVNYFDVFYHLLSDPSDTRFVEDFRRLREFGIPFVRFAANGFWPKDNRLYFEDKEAYFALLDRVVRAAENNGLGLVPTLFWNIATVPDLVGEPLSAWADPRSRTSTFMRTYTEEVVRRYQASPAIWMWEFGNEYNDHIDLPHSERYRPKIVPERGTPPARSEKDDMSSSMLMTAYQEWASTVRKLDPDRLISSGNDTPRDDARRLRTGEGEGMDTRAAWSDELLRQNGPFPVLSVHCYIDYRRFFHGEAVEMPEMLATVQRIAEKEGKPVFVGEFGATGDDVQAGDATFRTLLRAVEDSGVPLAAVWNFGPRRFSNTTDWNIDFTNEHAWMLSELRAANERFRKAKPSTPDCGHPHR